MGLTTPETERVVIPEPRPLELPAPPVEVPAPLEAPAPADPVPVG